MNRWEQKEVAFKSSSAESNRAVGAGLKPAPTRTGRRSAIGATGRSPPHMMVFAPRPGGLISGKGWQRKMLPALNPLTFLRKSCRIIIRIIRTLP